MAWIDSLDIPAGLEYAWSKLFQFASAVLQNKIVVQPRTVSRRKYTGLLARSLIILWQPLYDSFSSGRRASWDVFWSTLPFGSHAGANGWPGSGFSAFIYINAPRYKFGYSLLLDPPTTPTSWTGISGLSDSHLFCGVYNGAKFVCLSSQSNTDYKHSENGMVWTTRTGLPAGSWQGICYGNGQFVVVKWGSTNAVMTSPDGLVWTLHNMPASRQWRSVTFGNGVYVATADSGGAVKNIAYSSDGISWTMCATALSDWFGGVCFGNGYFVATPVNTFGRVARSTDGINWTQYTTPSGGNFFSVQYGNGYYVAVSQFGATKCMNSPDGSTWTARSAPGNVSMNWVGFGDGWFIATTGVSPTTLARSTDGTSWSAFNPGVGGFWGPPIYGAGRWICIRNFTTPLIMFSNFI